MPQLPSADDLGLIPGVPVAGKYRVDRVLGAGGVGGTFTAPICGAGDAGVGDAASD